MRNAPAVEGGTAPQFSCPDRPKHAMILAWIALGALLDRFQMHTIA